MGSSPDSDGDDYYYYNETMYLMSVPTISVFSDNSAICNTEDLASIIMDGKTQHALDVWHEIPGTARMDIILV